MDPLRDARGTQVVSSTLVLQCLRRLNAKRPSRRDDACECTAQDRRQHEDRRVAQNIEMHLRQVVVSETEPQDCTYANAQRHLNEWALEDDSQHVEGRRAWRDGHRICVEEG